MILFYNYMVFSATYVYCRYFASLTYQSRYLPAYIIDIGSIGVHLGDSFQHDSSSYTVGGDVRRLSSNGRSTDEGLVTAEWFSSPGLVSDDCLSLVRLSWTEVDAASTGVLAADFDDCVQQRPSLSLSLHVCWGNCWIFGRVLCYRSVDTVTKIETYHGVSTGWDKNLFVLGLYGVLWAQLDHDERWL